MSLSSKALLLTLASLASAQYGPGGSYGPSGGGGDSSNPFSGGGSQFGGFDIASFLNQREKILIAHGVLASLAFVILFPTGSILIRLASFPGLWLVHGLFQLFAYVVYIAAFGIGVWFVKNIPVSLLDHYHPVIGIVVFCLLFFQPILGLMHHYQFKKYSRRTLWSYGHLWLGRIVITLGMINGGLGMLLATDTGYFVPSRGQKIAYGVVAGIMWLLWMFSAIIGERRRARARKSPDSSARKEQYA
ncbi:hypothetical protein BU26DRAFT_342374 [Trematosphaeria pertusa]|uniref:Cytochrome b561 domain-containing protein n=1 Tax=Trematosphaeria pertusa TaxID=390896 RepID=A0A6A6IAP7_9PLEO|nr:uncharacterized protein BU26DRAFT_342374 [Trematosphaeria pertusa]KAF2247128.1 hypothetical protein BU26DRAFT_342374 [Trematosphaeria pertusa]